MRSVCQGYITIYMVLGVLSSLELSMKHHVRMKINSHTYQLVRGFTLFCKCLKIGHRFRT